MEEYVRVFFTGEALQRVFACICNNSNRDVQYKISKVIASMVKTTLCIRLTPVGLAPFRNDITMVIPYSMMDKTQLDFLDNIVQQVTFGSSGTGDPIRGVGIGNDVVVITVLDSCKIWSDSYTDRPPLAHRHSTTGTAQTERIHRAREEASRALTGKPMGGSMRWQLDTLDILKAFVACVFRSTSFTDDDMRSGICEIIVQMVIHEVGLTHNTVEMLKMFIQGIRKVRDC